MSHKRNYFNNYHTKNNDSTPYVVHLLKFTLKYIKHRNNYRRFNRNVLKYFRFAFDLFLSPLKRQWVKRCGTQSQVLPRQPRVEVVLLKSRVMWKIWGKNNPMLNVIHNISKLCIAHWQFLPYKSSLMQVSNAIFKQISQKFVINIDIFFKFVFIYAIHHLTDSFMSHILWEEKKKICIYLCYAPFNRLIDVLYFMRGEKENLYLFMLSTI